MSRPFTKVTPELLSRSLSGRLSGVVDRVRDIHTRLGLRPYVVRVVRTRWTGGERGQGVEEVISCDELSPTPKLVDMSTLEAAAQPIGLEELGSVKVDEISPRYTEDFLRGMDADGTPIGIDQNFYYEIEFPALPNRPAQKRRFTLASAPSYDTGRFFWTVTLERTSSVDELRQGELY